MPNYSSIILRIIGKARITGIIGLLSGNFASYIQGYLHKIPHYWQLLQYSLFTKTSKAAGGKMEASSRPSTSGVDVSELA